MDSRSLCDSGLDAQKIIGALPREVAAPSRAHSATKLVSGGSTQNSAAVGAACARDVEWCAGSSGDAPLPICSAVTHEQRERAWMARAEQKAWFSCLLQLLA